MKKVLCVTLRKAFFFVEAVKESLAVKPKNVSSG